MFHRAHMLSLGRATGWLNSEPLAPAETYLGYLYQLVRPGDVVRERTLEITFLEPGAEAYAFTLG